MTTKTELQKNFGKKYSYDGSLWSKNEGSAISYSDGDETEQNISDIISNVDDRCIFSDDLRSKVVDWPSFYYLSPIRTNILRPLSNFLKEGRGLEVGSGCGAITRYLGELGSEVFALEGSKRRAEITALRCSDLTNVNVVVDNIINFDIKGFNWATLIGVLEYAPRFIDSTDPVKSLLSHLYSVLNDDGTLIIAIENLLGLKYFAGAVEDHFGIPFYGLNDSYQDGTTRTYTKNYLTQELKEVGFSNIEFLYPFPDYKQPRVIITQKGAECKQFNVASMLSLSTRGNFDDVDRTFSECLAWRKIIENGNLGDLSNSFLIVARKTSKSVVEDNVLGYAYSTARGSVGAVETKVHLNDKIINIERTLLSQELIETPLVTQVVANEEYYSGEIYLERLFKIVNIPNWQVQDIVDWVIPWRDLLLSVMDKDGKLDGKYLDCCPQNIVIDEKGGLHPFDLEWIYKKELSLGFIITRGLLMSFLALDGVAAGPNSDREIGQIIIEVLQKLSMPIDEDIFHKYSNLESEFYFHTLKNFGDVHQKMGQRLKVRRSIHEYKDRISSLESKVSDCLSDIDVLQKEKRQLEQEYRGMVAATNEWKKTVDHIRNGKPWKIFLFFRHIKSIIKKDVTPNDPFSNFPDI